MNDDVSRKALLEFLHTLYKLNELSQAGKAIEYVIDKLESGAFPSIPYPAEGRYREALEQAEERLEKWIFRAREAESHIERMANTNADKEAAYAWMENKLKEVEIRLGNIVNSPLDTDAVIDLYNFVRGSDYDETLSPSGEQPGPSKSSMGLLLNQSEAGG